MAPWPHVVSSILLEPKTCPVEIHCEKQHKKKRGFCGGFHQRFWQIFVFDKYASQICFQFVIVILPAGHLLLQWLHFKLEGRKSNGFPIKNKNKFGEGWGCHLTIVWGRSFKSWWTAWTDFTQESWNSKNHKNISYPPENWDIPPFMGSWENHRLKTCGLR